MADDSISLRIQLPSMEQLPEPEAINYFTFSFFEPDIQLIVGYHIGKPSGGNSPARAMTSHIMR